MQESSQLERHATSRLGAVILGEGSPANGERHCLLFRCRKDNIDYLGQVKIDVAERSFGVEMFNENYFSRFEEGKPNVLRFLRNKLLELIGRPGRIPDPFYSLVLSHMDEGRAKLPTPPVPVVPGARHADLRELFDRLNRQYFGGRIEAEIAWGNRYRQRNRRTLRFGSYDSRKKLIKINPVLLRDMVPFPVLELTVYHEMCHQQKPPVKSRGRWLYHHPEFKRKEREYVLYREARLWEKAHWTKLIGVCENLSPSADNGSSVD